ncbi:JAB domain-containing protein [Sphingomonas sp. CARO-RG-8B-R24-01]|nr:JAB domain-containing protein [Sphingomonas sp. CARO-RG-8B-R24-01]
MIIHPSDMRDALTAGVLETLHDRLAPIATAAREMAVFVYLDPKWRVLGTREVSGGGVDSLIIPLRAVVADALEFDAAAIAMAHNHPGGDPTPSPADYAVTRRLARTLDSIGIALVEHLVLARGRRISFRAEGLL